MALIKCSECGHMISDKARKCPKCGCPVEHKEAVKEEQPQVAGSIMKPERPISTLSPGDVGVYDTEGEDNNKRKKKIIIIAVVAVIVLVALALTVNTGDKGTAGEDNVFAEDSIVDVADECTAASLLVSEENELDFTIRTDGVGSFLLGKPFNDYNTQAVNELYANDTIDIRSTFVVDENSDFEYYSYIPYMRLDNHGRTMLVLYGGSVSNDGELPDTKPSVGDCTVKGIHVYSPAFTTENGIHVGMTVEEIISKYGATIELLEGEGGEHIEVATLDVPGFKDMRFVIDLEPLISKHGGTDFLELYDDLGNGHARFKPNFWENLKKEIRDNCRLGRIFVGDFFDYTQEVSGLAVSGSGNSGSRTSQNVREWIQGTWKCTDPGVGSSKVIISGTKITVYIFGDLSYTGTYEIRGSELHYDIKKGQGSCYIDLDLDAHWLKYDKGAKSYMGKLVNGQYVYPNM